MKPLTPEYKQALWWTAAGFAVMTTTYLLTPDSPLALVSSLFGVCSVVLCVQGKLLTFFFGFGQILTYSYLCWQQRFYGALAINAFYFLSQLYGIYVWHRRIKTETLVRNMPPRRFVLLCAGLVALSALTGCLLQSYTQDSQPYMDAFTTMPAFAAQILLVLAYREQWYIWLTIDVLYVIMWLTAGSYCMAAQYLFWCANALYGSYRWRVTMQHSNPHGH